MTDRNERVGILEYGVIHTSANVVNTIATWHIVYMSKFADIILKYITVLYL